MKRKVTVSEARQAMTDALKSDPDYRQSWVANIACALMDEVDSLKKDSALRNRIAERIVRMIEE
jgi:Tfp pilus assembly protein PilF